MTCCKAKTLTLKWTSNLGRLDQQSSSIPSQGLVLGNQWRELENMKAQFVAVNGIRKVACVVRIHIIFSLCGFCFTIS